MHDAHVDESENQGSHSLRMLPHISHQVINIIAHVFQRDMSTSRAVIENDGNETTGGD